MAINNHHSIIHNNTNDLSAPLLPETTTTMSSSTMSNNNTSNNDHSILLRRLVQFVALCVGSLVAYASQYLLMRLLWKESILVDSESSIAAVILFSLHWSFWTCVVLLTSLLVLSNALEYGASIVFRHYHSNTTNNPMSMMRLSEDFMFQLESMYVLGALMTISAVWLFDTNVTTRTTLHHVNTTTTNEYGAVVATTVTNGSFFLSGLLMMGYSIVGWYAYCCLTSNMSSSTNAGTTTSLTSTWWTWYWSPHYRAATSVTMLTGLVVGSASQFLLCYFLWDENDGHHGILTTTTTTTSGHHTVVSSLLLFSLLWSTLTVCLTALGCVVLTTCAIPALVVSNSNSSNANMQQQRTLLRMEAVYIGCGLVGICGAWITIDIYHHMLSQVFPSLLLLGVSMVAFSAILQCFPEDDCVAVATSTSDETSRMLVVASAADHSINNASTTDNEYRTTAPFAAQLV